MGFKRRAATAGKLMIPDGARKKTELLHLHEILYIVKNTAFLLECKLDQTPSKFVQNSSHTIAQKGSSNVEIVGSGDKRLINATFVVTQDRRFLAIQLIYDRKTGRSIPRVDFQCELPNLKHFSNVEKSIKIINEILDLYFESQRK